MIVKLDGREIARKLFMLPQTPWMRLWTLSDVVYVDLFDHAQCIRAALGMSYIPFSFTIHGRMRNELIGPLAKDGRSLDLRFADGYLICKTGGYELIRLLIVHDEDDGWGELGNSIASCYVDQYQSPFVQVIKDAALVDVPIRISGGRVTFGGRNVEASFVRGQGEVSVHRDRLATTWNSLYEQEVGVSIAKSGVAIQDGNITHYIRRNNV